MTYQKPADAHENAIEAIDAMEEGPDYRASIETLHEDKEARRARRKALREAEERRGQEFRDILTVSYGTAEHPKAQRLFEIAWDLGHSSGYKEVLYWYDDLVDLLS